MTHEIKAPNQVAIEGPKMSCSSCGVEIYPEEIFYSLCIHMERRDAASGNIRILEIRPLEFRCQHCAEKRVAVC